MNKTDPYWSATLAAEKVVRERAISALPVDPIALAQDLGIEVIAKPASAQGVSGMLLRRGNAFGIAYATHIDSIGFQNFSVAHELGHYFLPGHIDAVLSDGDVHESHAGFASGDRYEMAADHFAATLLMPRSISKSRSKRSRRTRRSSNRGHRGFGDIERLGQVTETEKPSPDIENLRHRAGC